jgi:hypothetical protein
MDHPCRWGAGRPSYASRVAAVRRHATFVKGVHVLRARSPIHPTSGVAHPETYRGLMIAYPSDLGVTAVESALPLRRTDSPFLPLRP